MTLFALLCRRIHYDPLYALCDRFLDHRWRELEPGVKRCRVCSCTEYDKATPELIERWLRG